MALQSTSNGIYTSTYDGKRILKNSIIMEIVGNMDELYARIGMLISIKYVNIY
jgi:cob(I)alamin adenosyltransferase